MPHHHLRSPPWHVPCKAMYVHIQILYKNRFTYFSDFFRLEMTSFWGWVFLGLVYVRCPERPWVVGGGEEASSLLIQSPPQDSFITRHSFSFLPLNNKSGIPILPPPKHFFAIISSPEVRFERQDTYRFKDGIESGGRQISRVASNSLPCFVLKACDRYFVLQPLQPSGFGRAKLAVSPISPFLISSKLSGVGWLCGGSGNPNLGDFQCRQLLTGLIAAPACPIDGFGGVGEWESTIAHHL